MDTFNMSRIKSFMPQLPNRLPSLPDLPALPPLPKNLQNLNFQLPQLSGLSTPPLASPSLPVSHETVGQDDQLGSVPTTHIDPSPIPPPPKSNLDLVNACDSFPYLHTSPSDYLSHINSSYHLQVTSHPGVSLGYILPAVASLFANLPDWTLDTSSRTLTLLAGPDKESRSAAVAKTVAAMRELDHFSVLRGWRNELYSVHGPGREELFRIERAASALLGVVTYGAHMTAFQTDADQLQIWVPRRARTKQTYPGMLDNTVAGGLAAGETPLECIVREAEEEASLDQDLVRAKIRASGTVQYFHVRDERAGGESGLFQPECQYVYDLDLSGTGTVPKPGDGEAEAFELMDVNEIKESMARGEFKPNCALVLLDFFIRHGVLTPENEPDYVEIASRLRRVLEFPMR